MSEHKPYVPGPASGAHIDKEGEKWTLVVVRDLRHEPERVWEAITDPAQLREWAPFDASGNLGKTGAAVKLDTVGAPQPTVSETTVKRADPPHLLEYSWGNFDLKWELEPSEKGTRLTLWHNIARPYIAMGAAGWHVCLDVMDRMLSGDPVGRTVGPDAMKIEGWDRLHAEYAEQFGVKVLKW